jgi:hypothetical protein
MNSVVLYATEVDLLTESLDLAGYNVVPYLMLARFQPNDYVNVKDLISH